MAIETSNTPVLDGLLGQKAVLENKIQANNNTILSLQASIDAWQKSANDWWVLYLEDSGNLLRQKRAAERLANYDAARDKVTYYTTLKNEEIAKRNYSTKTLAQVNDAIDGYYQAQSEAIASGMPEGGSIQVAEQYAASIQAETAAMIAKATAEEAAAETKEKTQRNILIFAAVVVIAVMVYKFVIKRKK